MLTPVDIETIDFKKVALGYSPDEVNEFLDKVIVEFEMLYRENAKLTDRVNVLEDGLKYYKSLEDTLRNSIVIAEKAASETKFNANQSSEQIIRQAQLKATEILQDANKKLYEFEYKTLKMKNEYDSFKAKFNLLLETEMEILRNCEQNFNMDSYEELASCEEENDLIEE